METKLVAYRNNTSTPAVLEQYNLDLQKSPDVKVNYKWLDLQDPSSRKSSFTQTIKLPFTNTNNKFFENFFDVNLDTLVFNSKTKFSAVLSVDTVPQLDGFIQLKSIFLNAQLYEIALFGNVADFFTDIKDKKIRDTLIKEDGTELTRSFHRKVIVPGTLKGGTGSDKDDLVATDISGEDADVQAICNAAWTSQVKTDFTAFLVASKPAE